MTNHSLRASIESKNLFKDLNILTNLESQEKLAEAFNINAFIRIDSLFISPFSLLSIKRGLKGKLMYWEFSKDGWCFFFKEKVTVRFHGIFSSVIKDGVIHNIKIDIIKVSYTSKTYYDVLMRYFKCLDTFYFMVTDIDDSYCFLTNPLSINRTWNS
ncbi:hypothetical protein NEFER03_0261 [Nematocida sp. LUAm3]|nr:hypothetical protein NEFER03_0261 [Nematocida sp. LUAm3]KAI5173714.1 hypothetical protein NEFER02_0230 [Nematocida sp. LUAm2]KAI5176936.1 hypothetical protein NEFER01_0261 [Nematocida sp. LUAm1]